jgi:hypothetical protein
MMRGGLAPSTFSNIVREGEGGGKIVHQETRCSSRPNWPPGIKSIGEEREADRLPDTQPRAIVIASPTAFSSCFTPLLLPPPPPSTVAAATTATVTTTTTTTTTTTSTTSFSVPFIFASRGDVDSQCESCRKRNSPHWQLRLLLQIQNSQLYWVMLLSFDFPRMQNCLLAAAFFLRHLHRH